MLSNMTEKRQSTEAEAKALEGIIRHARGLALAVESWAKAKLERSSRIGETEQIPSTRKASPGI